MKDNVPTLWSISSYNQLFNIIFLSVVEQIVLSKVWNFSHKRIAKSNKPSRKIALNFIFIESRRPRKVAFSSFQGWCYFQLWKVIKSLSITILYLSFRDMRIKPMLLQSAEEQKISFRLTYSVPTINTPYCTFIHIYD